ncbi:hypothetical protein CIPAW_12G036800 [Carya illinoinensis]|uniref:Uncharacterized protein n=1 Tax=Carya illinoinensis TaxID=32201 RepID=A0A8T1NS96_CARIL|nr:hypothetical protein CIPAW_12G036800 [Carya illinoinensis]
MPRTRLCSSINSRDGQRVKGTCPRRKTNLQVSNLMPTSFAYLFMFK